MTLPSAIRAAAEHIHPYARPTPLDASPHFSALTGAQVHLKLENLQHTGSFKLRGATHKLLCLTDAQRQAGVVAASSGNHGAAVAYAAHALGTQALVFVPETASPTKLAAMRRYGAAIRQVGEDSLVAELAARDYAAAHSLAYISPYNDLEVVAGQGTVAVELLRQLPTVDALYVAVGGGGLIGGMAAYAKTQRPTLRVVGCLPANSAVMAASVQAGHIVEQPSLPTLSDGTAGGIEPRAVTFALCQELVDEFVLVSEAEIAAAMREVMESHHLLVEGAAGVALAGLLRTAEAVRRQQVAVVLCGANISLETLRSIL